VVDGKGKEDTAKMVKTLRHIEESYAHLPPVRNGCFFEANKVSVTWCFRSRSSYKVVIKGGSKVSGRWCER